MKGLRGDFQEAYFSTHMYEGWSMIHDVSENGFEQASDVRDDDDNLETGSAFARAHAEGIFEA